MSGKNILKFGFNGTDVDLWETFKTKLMEMVIRLMDSNVNPNQDATLRNEVHRIAENLFDFANAKLEKATIENYKMKTEIETLISEATRNNAEARRINAEAEAIEIENANKKFQFALGAARAIAAMDGNEEALLFCKNIELMLRQFQAKIGNVNHLDSNDC